MHPLSIPRLPPYDSSFNEACEGLKQKIVGYLEDVNRNFPGASLPRPVLSDHNGSSHQISKVSRSFIPDAWRTNHDSTSNESTLAMVEELCRESRTISQSIEERGGGSLYENQYYNFQSSNKNDEQDLIVSASPGESEMTVEQYARGPSPITLPPSSIAQHRNLIQSHSYDTGTTIGKNSSERYLDGADGGPGGGGIKETSYYKIHSEEVSENSSRPISLSNCDEKLISGQFHSTAGEGGGGGLPAPTSIMASSGGLPAPIGNSDQAVQDLLHEIDMIREQTSRQQSGILNDSSIVMI